MNGHPALVYAGLDFILDRGGQWHFLEINDHPAALAKADALAAQNPGHLFPDGAVRHLARTMCDLRTSDHVALLLPDCFEISGRRHAAPVVELVKGQVFDDARIATTLEDFNSLAASLHDLGVPCSIVDLNGIRAAKGKAYLLDATELGCLFRRSYSFPSDPLTIPCVNDLRTRRICTDKLLTFEILRRHCPDVPQIETHSHAQKADLYEFLQRMARRDKWIVEKPINGSASVGVRRRRPEEIAAEVYQTTKDNVNLIYQPWVEPALIRDGSFDYYADVRIYSMNRKIVTGFARRSAGPTHGAAAGTMLSLLTTTGRRAPLVSIDGLMAQKEPGLVLSRRAFEQLIELGERVASVIDTVTRIPDYKESCSGIGTFRELLDVKGKVKMVRLAPGNRHGTTESVVNSLA